MDHPLLMQKLQELKSSLSTIEYSVDLQSGSEVSNVGYKDRLEILSLESL